MAYFFFDTSGLAKRYINEIGTVWVKNVCLYSTGNIVFIAEITTVEITSAITRRARGGTLTIADAAAAIARFEADLQNEYISLEVTSELLFEACRLVKTYGLRAYDAVQLAAAVSFNREQIALGLPSVTFVSADYELLAAALSEALLIENPNNH